MRLSRLVVLAAALSLTFTTVPASYSDLQVTFVSTSANLVSVTIHNPNRGPESARVRATVKLVDNSHQTITGSVFTIAGGANLVVVLSASKTVSGIDDDPVPINP